MCRKIYPSIVFLVASALSQFAFGVEAPSLTSRFRLVGIIAAADRKGNDASLAVIRDEQLGRSIMVRRGEHLPGVEGVVLSTIKRSEIELTAAGQVTVVGYIGTETKEEQKDLVPDYMNTDDLDAFYYDHRMSSGDSTSESPTEYIYAPIGGVTETVESVTSNLADKTSDTSAVINRFDDLGKSREMIGIGSQGEFGRESESTFDRSVRGEEPRVERVTGGLYNEYDGSSEVSSETTSEIGSSEMVEGIED